MKIAIIYYSNHHNNTKKLVDAISNHVSVDIFDVNNNQNIDLSKYDLIGFASGIYYSNFHESVLKFAEDNLSQGKNVFLIYTYGIKRNGYLNKIKEITDSKNSNLLGIYECPGFNTFGPFKIVGGINKKRPNSEDIDGFIQFFDEIKSKEVV